MRFAGFVYAGIRPFFLSPDVTVPTGTADDPLSGMDPTGHLVAMLPDGGTYYRTAPPPARSVAPPPVPPSYYAQQAAQAFTNPR